jgi:DNA polymerase-3 subunit gamma/tau
MLSDAAFNALLKTLEEPPAHVLFFFATTEPNKIPVTILSRCQRYDFRRVAIDDITALMAEICRQEQMQISQNALAVIAREADGSIRDGLSLLDQIVTCSSEQVSDEQVVEMLGVIDRQVLFDAADALFSGNAAALVGICDALYRQGRHLLRFYSELIVHFRNLLLIKMGGAGKSLTDVPEHEKKQMAKQVEHVSEPYLSQIVNTLFSDEWRIRQSVSPRHALEMTFFKLLQIRPAMSMDTLIEKLDQLRQEMGGRLPVNAVPEAASEPRNPEPAALPENLHPGPEPKPEPETAPEPVPETAPEPDGPETASTPEDPAAGYETNGALWAALKNHIAAQKPSLAACMGESQLREINGSRLVIDIKSSGSNIELLDRKKSITRMEQLCSEFLKKFNGKIVDIKILPAGGNTQ